MSFSESETFDCPYCGSLNSLFVDPTGGSRQSFVVDCETCCAPIVIRLKLDGQDIVSIDIKRENQ